MPQSSFDLLTRFNRVVCIVICVLHILACLTTLVQTSGFEAGLWAAINLSIALIMILLAIEIHRRSIGIISCSIIGCISIYGLVMSADINYVWYNFVDGITIIACLFTTTWHAIWRWVHHVHR